MPAELPERHRGLFVGRGLGHRSARHDAEDGELSACQRPARRARLRSCSSSQGEQSDGDRQKQAEGGLDCLVALELPLLEPAPALQGRAGQGEDEGEGDRVSRWPDSLPVIDFLLLGIRKVRANESKRAKRDKAKAASATFAG